MIKSCKHPKERIGEFMKDGTTRKCVVPCELMKQPQRSERCKQYAIDAGKIRKKGAKKTREELMVELSGLRGTYNKNKRMLNATKDEDKKKNIEKRISSNENKMDKLILRIKKMEGIDIKDDKDKPAKKENKSSKKDTPKKEKVDDKPLSRSELMIKLSGLNGLKMRNERIIQNTKDENKKLEAQKEIKNIEKEMETYKKQLSKIDKPEEKKEIKVVDIKPEKKDIKPEKKEEFKKYNPLMGAMLNKEPPLKMNKRPPILQYDSDDSINNFNNKPIIKQPIRNKGGKNISNTLSLYGFF